MKHVTPAEIFAGTTMVVAPHMDDCVLSCGGSLAQLDDASRVHMVYATDGRRSPAPEIPWLDRVDSSLGATRESEARSAMRLVGLPPGNVHFLGLPDGRLGGRAGELRDRLVDLARETGATSLFIPFRFDRHPDHIAVNKAITSAVLDGAIEATVWEFFVYHRWRLLTKGDIRLYIRNQDLVEIDVSGVSDVKRAALQAFASQTTRFYPWQSRPNLTAALIDEVSLEPEVFLRFDPQRGGTAVLTGPILWIRIAHRLEPFLKRHKDRVVAVGRRLAGRRMGAS
jgi:LmbE family N-acetylglucosaminyl deacetylase